MRVDPDVKWRGSRAQSVRLLVVAAVLAVAGVLVDKWDGPSWLIVGLAVCAAAGAVWLGWRKERAAAADAQATTLATSSQPHLDTAGQLRTVGGTGWDEFRVQPAAVELGYIPRDVQQGMRDQVLEGRPVLVVGHSMSGKTRMAYEVIRELYHDWPVWIPERPDGLAQLMPHGVPQQTVVWLDDLEAFLTSEQQLRLSWLAQLENAGCRVVATIRSSEYEKFQPVGEVKPPQWEVIQRFALIRLLDDQDEQDRIAAGVADESTAAGISRYGIAEYVGGGYLALDRFENGRAAHPLAVAMLRAAADWRWLGFESIPSATMLALAPTYLSDKLRTTPGEADIAALTWASAEFGGRIRLLEPAGIDAWRVFDYLLDYLTRGDWPIPEPTWTIAAEAARPNPRQTSVLGFVAYLDGRIDLATSLWRSAAPSAPVAAFSLGLLLTEQGDLEDAATAYQQVIETRDPEWAAKAAINLGILREKQSNTESAIAAFQQALDTGDPEVVPRATFNLGILRMEQGDLEGATTALQRAIDIADPDRASIAALYLGKLCREHGDLDRAITAYQQAIDANHPNHAPNAVLNLALLRKDHGDLEGAIATFRQVLRTDNPNLTPIAAFGLGALLEDEGDLEGAITAFQQAINTNDPDLTPKAALALGKLQMEQGDAEGAITAFQLAINTNDPDLTATTALNLGLLHMKQGDLEGAITDLQQAIDTRHPDLAPIAMLALGILQMEQGNAESAAAAFQQAIDTNHPEVMLDAQEALGWLQHE